MGSSNSRLRVRSKCAKIKGKLDFTVVMVAVELSSEYCSMQWQPLSNCVGKPRGSWAGAVSVAVEVPWVASWLFPWQLFYTTWSCFELITTFTVTHESFNDCFQKFFFLSLSWRPYLFRDCLTHGGILPPASTKQFTEMELRVSLVSANHWMCWEKSAMGGAGGIHSKYQGILCAASLHSISCQNEWGGSNTTLSRPWRSQLPQKLRSGSGHKMKKLTS